MELGVRVNAGSDHEDDTPLDGMEWPSVDVHGMRQSRVVWLKGASDNLTRTQALNTSAIELYLAHRSWPLPLPRTSRAALRSPCDTGWVLPAPSAGCTCNLDSLLHSEEARRIFHCARDAMAGVDAVPQCTCPSLALAACRFQFNRP